MAILLLLTKKVASLIAWGHTKIAKDAGKNGNNPKSTVTAKI